MSENKKLKIFEFVIYENVFSYVVYWIKSATPHEALVNYWKNIYSTTGARLNAIKALCFEDALQLVNEWVANDEKIISVHEVKDPIWCLKGNITCIEPEE